MSVRFIYILMLFTGLTQAVQAQLSGPDRSQWGPNDTIRVPAVFYNNEWLPYARNASVVINEVNAHLKNTNSKKERKDYIKSREDDLRKQFSEPLSNLSVYQGKVLMKLINRQTGNDCYEIIKEYRGGLNARMYQTVAFVFGSSLKQHYDAQNDQYDRQIENIVKEIDGIWYNNPHRPGVTSHSR